MEDTRSPSQLITETVTSWPGVDAAPGRRGEFAFSVGGREIGHLHGDRSAHFGFPKDVGAKLKAEGRVVDHPVFPGKPGLAARRIDDSSDVLEVIELMRLNYDRLVAKHGVPEPVNSRPRGAGVSVALAAAPGIARSLPRARVQAPVGLHPKRMYWRQTDAILWMCQACRSRTCRRTCTRCCGREPRRPASPCRSTCWDGSSTRRAAPRSMSC